METRHLSVERSARYHLLGDPDAAWSEVWYLVHGYGQLASEMLVGAEPLADPGRLLVAPEGLSRYYPRGSDGRIGASWMTRADRDAEIQDYVGYLDRLHATLVGARGDDVAACVLGFSQGAATVARWSVLGAMRPARMVLWAGGFPPDLDAEGARAALADTEVELVVGDADPYLSAERLAEEEARLRGAAPAARLRRFSGRHEVPADVLAAVIA